MKKLIIIFILFSSASMAQVIKVGDARGLFMSVGVGPKIPIGDFSTNQTVGSGFDVTFSYTGNRIVPLFLYTKVGYQHYPGKQSFYQTSDYSSFSTNMIFVNGGVRYFYNPLFERVILFMPIIEAGLSFGYFEKRHEFKIDRNRSGFTEDLIKLGFHVGGGISMFLLDVMGYYNYFEGNQYLSVDLRVRIPIFVNF